MKTYRLSPNAINKYSKPRVVLYSIVAVFLVITLLLSIWVNLYTTNTSWLVLSTNVVVWGYATYWSFNFALSQRKIWGSYELQMNADSITYQWKFTKFPICIRRENVKRIEKQEGGGIRVTGNRKDVIPVSAALDDFEEVSKHLEEWMNIEPVSQFKVYARFVIFGSLLATIMTYFFTRPIMLLLNVPFVFLILSVSLGALILFQFVSDKRLKLLSLLYALPLVVAYFNISSSPFVIAALFLLP